MCVKYRFNKEFYFYFFNFITRFRENIESKIFSKKKNYNTIIMVVEIYFYLSDDKYKQLAFKLSIILSIFIRCSIFSISLFIYSFVRSFLFAVLLIMREKQCLQIVFEVMEKRYYLYRSLCKYILFNYKLIHQNIIYLPIKMMFSRLNLSIFLYVVL